MRGGGCVLRSCSHISSVTWRTWPFVTASDATFQCTLGRFIVLHMVLIRYPKCFGRAPYIPPHTHIPDITWLTGRPWQDVEQGAHTRTHLARFYQQLYTIHTCVDWCGYTFNWRNMSVLQGKKHSVSRWIHLLCMEYDTVSKVCTMLIHYSLCKKDPKHWNMPGMLFKYWYTTIWYSDILYLLVLIPLV